MDRRKSEKSERVPDIGQLKKDVSSVSKSLLLLGARLEVIEANLVVSSEAKTIENNLRVQVSDLTKKVDQQNESDEKHRASFADMTLKLGKEFDKRIDEHRQSFESRLKEETAKLEATNRTLQSKWNLEKKSNAANNSIEATTRRQLESRIKQLEEQQEQGNTHHRTAQIELQLHLDSANQRNESLSKQLDDQQIMLKGRDTEIALLQKKMAGIEAFGVLPIDCIQSSLREVQDALQKFCHQCIEKADLLPVNRMPNALQRSTLPPRFLTTTTTGRQIFAATLQNAIVGVMVDKIFVSTPYCFCPQMTAISDALYRDNKLHEAVWRAMAANVLLSHDDVMRTVCKKLDAAAAHLLGSWQLFENGPLHEMHTWLSSIFADSLKCWLQLMTIQDKIYVAHTGKTNCFDTDSTHTSDEGAKVPGGFAAEKTPVRVLCLFPAILRDSTAGRTMKSTVLYRGTAVDSDSPMLLQAFKEYSDVQSPKLSNKRLSISGKEAPDAA